MLLLICGALPIALGLALPVLKIKNRKARMTYAVAAACVSSLGVFYLLLSGDGGKTTLFRLTDAFVCSFHLTGAGKVYLGLAAALWPLSMLYAAEYMAHEEREGLFFSWYLAVYGAVIFFAAADNLFTLYIFYELITLLTVPLVTHKQDGASIRAGRTYMLFLFGGAALGFAAMMGLSAFGLGAFNGASFDYFALSSGQIAWIQALALAAFLGFGVKAAMLPLCAWLPAASVAPTPVTALLHAVAVVNAGVYAVTRLLYDVLPQSVLVNAWPQTAMLILSMCTIVYASAMAVREKQVKKRLAWSTVANLSYMLLGLSLLTEEGRNAAAFHMVFHGLMKITLFFCAGAVLIKTGRTTVRSMQGLGRKMPLTFFAFTLAGAALMGLPPLPGFISKYALASAALQRGDGLGYLGVISLLISSVLTVIYIFTVVYPAFFMRYQQMEGEAPPHDSGAPIKITLCALMILLILCGVFGGHVTALIGGWMGGGVG